MIRVSDTRHRAEIFIGPRALPSDFRVAPGAGGLYPRPWDTPPQRGALIWKGSIDGYFDTGNAAG